MKKSQLLIVILIISTTLFGCNFETQSHHPFKSQTLAIAGDSITWGVDPDNEGSQIPDPWVEQVGEKLGFKKTINYGVPSASVMDGDLSDGSPTPVALVNEYKNYSDDIDVLGFMIGINDAFRGYPLGEWGDKDATTFYGAFYIMCNGIIEKYPPSDHDVFMILYPAYAGVANWESYVEAMRKTANYFSIPCLDLSSEMGISIYSDTQCLYWRGNYGQFCDRNPHPTQECADVIAECVSNYIYSHFSQ